MRRSKPDPDCRADAGARARRGSRASSCKRDGADMSKWRWGDEHVALLQHKVYSHIPLLDRFSDLSLPSSGDFTRSIAAAASTSPEDMPFARTHAGGFRGLYDLADPDKSRFMITTGQSGHIFSPHYRRPAAAVDRRQVDSAGGDRSGASEGGRGGAGVSAEVKDIGVSFPRKRKSRRGVTTRRPGRRGTRRETRKPGRVVVFWMLAFASTATACDEHSRR